MVDVYLIVYNQEKTQAKVMWRERLVYYLYATPAEPWIRSDACREFCHSIQIIYWIIYTYLYIYNTILIYIDINISLQVK